MNKHVNKKRRAVTTVPVLDLSKHDPGQDELGLSLHGEAYIKASSDCHTCNRQRMLRQVGRDAEGQPLKPRMCPCVHGRYLKVVQAVLMELNRQMASKKFKDKAEGDAERDRLLPAIRAKLGF